MLELPSQVKGTRFRAWFRRSSCVRVTSRLILSILCDFKLIDEISFSATVNFGSVEIL